MSVVYVKKYFCFLIFIFFILEWREKNLRFHNLLFPGLSTPIGVIWVLIWGHLSFPIWISFSCCFQLFKSYGTIAWKRKWIMVLFSGINTVFVQLWIEYELNNEISLDFCCSFILLVFNNTGFWVLIVLVLQELHEPVIGNLYCVI